MSFGGSLLKGSKYHAQYISFVEQSDQFSDIELSSQQQKIREKNNINQSKPISRPLVLRCSNDLLSVPCADYYEKSQIYLQKQIEEKIQKNFQKQLYYGKRKNKVIEISDVSSEQDEPSDRQKKPRHQRRNNSQQDDDYQQRIARILHNTENIEQKRISRRQARSNNLHHHTHHRNQQRSREKPSVTTTNNRRNYRNRIQSEIQKQSQKIVEQEKPENELSHLHPDYEENQHEEQNNYDSDQQISEMGSDKSVFVVRRKGKPTHKRLRKMVNMTNRVKIENKQNSGQTQQCPICLVDLNQKTQRKKGKLPCKHIFCLKCILEASRFSNRCPYCRASFNEIISNGKRIQVEDTHLNQQFEDPNEQPCYVCGRNDDFERLLECQFCEYAYCHTYCDPRLNRNEPPDGEWYCENCTQLWRQRQQNRERENEENAENPVNLQQGNERQHNDVIKIREQDIDLSFEDNQKQIQQGRVAGLVKIQQRIVSQASRRIEQIQQQKQRQKASQGIKRINKIHYERAQQQQSYYGQDQSQARINKSRKISQQQQWNCGINDINQSQKIKLQDSHQDVRESHQKEDIKDSQQQNYMSKQVLKGQQKRKIQQSEIEKDSYYSQIDKDYDDIDL